MHSYRPAHARRSFATLLALVLILPLTLTLSGCARAYTQSDVEDYVRNELGIEEFTVASEPEEKRRAGASYKIWAVTTDWYGLGEPITFNVEEYKYEGLSGDASQALIEAIGRMYRPKGKLTGLQVGDDGTEHFDGWRYPVSSRADFEGAWPEIQEFQTFLQKYPRLSDMSFPIEYYAESANEIEQQADAFLPDYTIGIKLSSTHKDFLNQLYVPQDKGKQDFRIVDEYLHDCLELGLRRRIDEFSDKEITRVVKASTYMEPVRDYYTEKVLDSTVVFDAGGSPHRLAYGHLFELARAAGLQVEGTWAQFVVHGADGQEHAFAYEYVEYNKGNRFAEQDVAEQVLGLKLDIYQEWVDCTITAEMLAYAGVSPQELANHLKVNAEGRKVTTKIVDGGVQIHAKRGALLSASDAYVDEARKLEEEVRETSGTDFHFRLRDYMNEKNDMEVVLYSEKDVAGKNAKRVEKIVKLLYLSEQLFDSGEPFLVSVQKSSGSDATEIVTFSMPDDEVDFSDVWR